MSKKQKVIGVDGCRDGWLATIYDHSGYHIRLYETINELIEEHADAILILVDMPMGLSDFRVQRDVDKQLRNLLKPHRHQSVFTPPARQTLEAGTYSEALEINRSITGKGISLQSWHIAPKIKELDKLLQEQSWLRDITFESHPEANFWLLNQKTPLQFGKHNASGLNERLAILVRHEPLFHKLFEQAKNAYPKQTVKADDILDAICLCYSAEKAMKNQMVLLEDHYKADSMGIPIRIVLTEPCDMAG